MKKKTMNSYVKLIIVMCIGGLIGAVIGFSSFFFGGNLASALSASAHIIEANAHLILWFLALLALFISLFCYHRSGTILKQSLITTDDEKQDILDDQYDFWGTFGITASNILLGVAFISFSFTSSDIGSIDLSQIGQSTAAFLFCMIICIVYQIAAVKQMKKKDPVKYDDAMSLKFQEKFLETCDEGEKLIIYKSAYKTFIFMQQITMYVLCIACIGHMLFRTGITAVVLIGILYITMTTAYSIYSLKFQRAGK